MSDAGAELARDEASPRGPLGVWLARLVAAASSPLFIALAAVPLHLALALGTDLSPDEAYYLSAARAPHLSALVDHPPLLPALLRVGDALPLPLELRVRIWPILWSFALTLAAVHLAKRRGASAEGRAAAAWLVGWSLLPTVGGFVATPDGPALLGVAACLAWGGDEPEPRALGWSDVALGACAAIGALGKVVLLPIVALVALAAPWRSFARRAAFAMPCALVLPLLVPSLRFQLAHAYGAAGPPWGAGAAIGAMLAAVAAQLLLWSPWVVVRGARALGALPRADRALAIGLGALVLASALVRAVPPEPNWWAPGALVLVIGATLAVESLAPRRRAAMLAIAVAPSLFAAAHAIAPYLPIPRNLDPTARLHGWSHGQPPRRAPGVGAYGPAAERCAYQGSCEEIRMYFDSLNAHH